MSDFQNENVVTPEPAMPKLILAQPEIQVQMSEPADENVQSVRCKNSQSVRTRKTIAGPDKKWQLFSQHRQSIGLGDMDVEDFEINVDCQTVERPLIPIPEVQKQTPQGRADRKAQVDGDQANFDLRKLGKGKSGRSKSKNGRNPKLIG